ncbi:tetraacyldisaccharide 4'-kinase [Hydrogenophaga sp.]|uniref:tetraacyldisaccharide 4'-kinase n=1 Tax=Hydrogenophaga sp. TaxID=1904254 RepID=UPI0025C2E64D|nr:tetraacyldisaccharide 4'-kinase [Hydrogenophaga sp.]MBT9462509.1 tetraacyldisaccharide 4'-kinase [Hydrogenophaga sp.]
MSRSRWQALWLVHSRKRGWLACLLWPVSLVYAGLMALRRALYALGIFKTHRIQVPVIVIGNVVVGGAGKTPTVIAVVNHLREQGWRPGVVSRGHGRHSQEVVEVTPDTPPEDGGDEPALIRLRTGVPVFVAASRVAAANTLVDAHPEVNILVCDDGLQHWALHRDLQIVVFDDRGTGNGWLLPAGLLREAWPRSSSGSLPTDLVLHQHREDATAPARVSAPGASLFSATRRLATHAVGPSGERMPLHELCNHRLTAVAGIARPSVFFDMLHAAGLRPELEVALPDHADAADYAALTHDPARTLLCTEKDAVKLFPLLTHMPPATRVQAWAVPLEMTPDPAFFNTLEHHLLALGRKP